MQKNIFKCSVTNVRNLRLPPCSCPKNSYALSKACHLEVHIKKLPAMSCNQLLLYSAYVLHITPTPAFAALAAPPPHAAPG